MEHAINTARTPQIYHQVMIIINGKESKHKPISSPCED